MKMNKDERIEELVKECNKETDRADKAEAALIALHETLSYHAWVDIPLDIRCQVIDIVQKEKR